jgi:large subunit ribosomal protein L35
MKTVKKYKLKTHKATAKRVAMTGSGKFRHLPAARTKYHRKKDAQRNRELSRLTPMAEGDAKKMKALLPYGK